MDPVTLRIALDDALHRYMDAVVRENRARWRMLKRADPAKLDEILEALAEEVLEASGMIHLVVGQARELAEDLEAIELRPEWRVSRTAPERRP